MLQGFTCPPENGTHWNEAGFVACRVTAHLARSIALAPPARAPAPAPRAAPVTVLNKSLSAGLRGQNFEGAFFLLLLAFLAKTFAAAASASSAALAASTGGSKATAIPKAIAPNGSAFNGRAAAGKISCAPWVRVELFFPGGEEGAVPLPGAVPSFEGEEEGDPREGSVPLGPPPRTGGLATCAGPAPFLPPGNGKPAWLGSLQ